MKSILFAFDFDQTLLAKNTDVDIQKLSPEGGEIPNDIHEIARKEDWTAFVNACLKYFHEKGISKERILDHIKSMPYIEGAIDMIKTLKNEYQADLIIISDANSIYIKESLENAGIHEAFSKIYTNPAEFTSDGQLIVTPFTNQTECLRPEGLCGANLCKGKVLLDFVKSKDYSLICYAGDGGNDFCPIEKLSSEDLAFVRKNYALEKKIPKMKETRGIEIKANIHYWENAHDIMKILQEKFTPNLPQ